MIVGYVAVYIIYKNLTRITVTTWEYCHSVKQIKYEIRNLTKFYIQYMWRIKTVNEIWAAGTVVKSMKGHQAKFY